MESKRIELKLNKNNFILLKNNFGFELNKKKLKQIEKYKSSMKNRSKSEKIEKNSTFC